MQEQFTVDDFLGGKIKLKQPLSGYRATSDAVLLAAAVCAKKGQTILDVGAGTGAVGLCLLARCPDLSVCGIELQPELSALANENIRFNNLSDKALVVTADIRLKKINGIKTGSFDWVVSNPPFILEDQISPNPLKDKAHRESACSLKEWVAHCLRYVAARGYFAMINRADRLTEISSLLHGKLGGIRIIPVWTKEKQPAKRIIVIGRKGVRSPDILEPGITLTREDGTRTMKAEEIMRQGKALVF